MDNAKKRRWITRVYTVVSLVLLAALVLWCGLLIHEAFYPNGNSAGAVLAELAAVLLVFVFSLGAAVLELMLFEVFVLVRYLLTDVHKKTSFTVCNVVSASVAILLPVVVLLCNVQEWDQDGTLSLWLLISWGVLWALFRIVYAVLRKAEKQRDFLQE